MKTFTVHQEVTAERVSDLICSALEGGSNYWYMIEKKIEPTAWTFDSEKVSPRHYIGDYPLNPGGKLIFSVREPENDDEKAARHELTWETIASGLNVMARDYGETFGNFMSENDDAETGDVFLQCCLFQEVKYG